MNLFLLLMGCPDVEPKLFTSAPVFEPEQLLEASAMKQPAADFSSDEDGGLLSCKRGTSDGDCYVTCTSGKKVFWEDPCPIAVNQRYWR